MHEQGHDVLADVKIACTFPVALRMVLIVSQGSCGYLVLVFGAIQRDI